MHKLKRALDLRHQAHLPAGPWDNSGMGGGGRKVTHEFDGYE